MKTDFNAIHSAMNQYVLSKHIKGSTEEFDLYRGVFEIGLCTNMLEVAMLILPQLHISCSM